MKKINFLLVLSAMMISSFAQVPQSFNYQAVVRESDGSASINKAVVLTINILEKSINGTSVYSEEHNVTTNDFGLVNLEIGKGTTTDNFSSINWADTTHYLKLELDGQLIGTQQLLSVPYAIAASTLEGYTPTEMTKLLNVIKYSSGLKLIDYDGNEYDGVRVGTVMWMAEDLKTLHYSDGREIPRYSDTLFSIDTIKYYNTRFYTFTPDSFIGNPIFYSQPAIYDSVTIPDDINDLKIQGICPKGWRIPNNNDYIELIKVSEGDADRLLDPRCNNNIISENSLGTNFLRNGKYMEYGPQYRFFPGASYFPLSYSLFSSQQIARVYKFNNINYIEYTDLLYNGFIPVRCVKDL